MWEKGCHVKGRVGGGEGGGGLVSRLFRVRLRQGPYKTFHLIAGAMILYLFHIAHQQLRLPLGRELDDLLEEEDVLLIALIPQER